MLDQGYAAPAIRSRSAPLADLSDRCCSEFHLGFDSAVTDSVTVANDHDYMLGTLNLISPVRSTSEGGDTVQAMLIVSGVITFDPAKQSDLVALLGPLVEATLAEDGNITYGFWLDPFDSGRTRVYEEWESTDAMNEHMGSAHMANFLQGMGDIGVTGVEIIQHEVAGSSKLM